MNFHEFWNNKSVIIREIYGKIKPKHHFELKHKK